MGANERDPRGVNGSCLRLVSTWYSTESYCGACERKLGGPYGSWYPHAGMRFCPYCGVFLDDAEAVEDSRAPAPSRGTHRLVMQDEQREREQEHERNLDRQASAMCHCCGHVPDPLDPLFDRVHDVTPEEALWNPAPVGKHAHRACRACGDDVILFVMTGEDDQAIVTYRPDEPRYGPLA